MLGYRAMQEHKGMLRYYLLENVDMYISDCHLHSKGCWGYYILRTTYGNDQRVAAALRHFDDAIYNKLAVWRTMDNHSRTELDKEAQARYHSTLIEHSSLDGADFEAAREYFRKWAEPYIVPPIDEEEEGAGDDEDEVEDTLLDDVSRTPRFRAFFLLDEQALDNLERFPARGDLEAFEQLSNNLEAPWLKLVGTNDRAHYGKLGVRAYDLLDIYSWLGD